jgi:hypothetical protein
MLFFNRAKLVLLSQPKTGSTAMVKSLSGSAAMAFNHPPALKHIGYDAFMRSVVPLIRRNIDMNREDYDVVAVMREPLDWLGSWYRYRSRENLRRKEDGNADRYVGNMSFEEFLVLACQRNSQSAAVKAGSPCGVALRKNGMIGVDLLFPYEDLSGFYDMIEMRVRTELNMQRHNVSPTRELTISKEVEDMFRDAFRPEIELHASLVREGTIDPEFRNRTILK